MGCVSRHLRHPSQLLLCHGNLEPRHLAALVIHGPNSAGRSGPRAAVCLCFFATQALMKARNGTRRYETPFPARAFTIVAAYCRSRLRLGQVLGPERRRKPLWRHAGRLEGHSIYQKVEDTDRIASRDTRGHTSHRTPPCPLHVILFWRRSSRYGTAAGAARAGPCAGHACNGRTPAPP